MWSSTLLCHSHWTKPEKKRQSWWWRHSVRTRRTSASCLQFRVTTTVPSHSSQHTKKTWSLTSESPVYSLDSPENHTAASLLNPSGCCYSGPDVSDGRGWTSELRPENHSWSLTNCISTIWIKNKRWNDWWSIRCVEVLNVSSSMCVLTRNEAQHYTVI